MSQDNRRRRGGRQGRSENNGPRRGRGRGGYRRRTGPPSFDPGDPYRGRDEVPVEETAFSEFGLAEDLVKALARSGYRDLTAFQRETLPHLLKGDSLIASTGGATGRTVSFLVPLIQRLTEETGHRVLIVVPTRNLAAQVYNETRRLTFFMDKEVALLDAGARIASQAEVLEGEPAFVVGTPGRILDHIRRENAAFGDLDGTVLVEVDRMLDQDQMSDVEEILAKIENTGQVIQITTAVSPALFRFCRAKAAGATELLEIPEECSLTAKNNFYLSVDARRKRNALAGLIEEERPERAVIFCRRKGDANRIAERLDATYGKTLPLYAGMTLRRRRQIAERFCAGEFDLLVTTDAGISALEVAGVTFVAHYDIPDEAGDYLFRLGAIARLDADRTVVTLVDEEEGGILKEIEESLGISFEERTLRSRGRPRRRRRRGGRARGASGSSSAPDRNRFEPLPSESAGEGEEPFLPDDDEVATPAETGPDSPDRPRDVPEEKTEEGAKERKKGFFSRGWFGKLRRRR
jgi:ATP-dependent RNA helicase DeaD